MSVINNMTREKRLEIYPERDHSIPREKLNVKKHLDSQVRAILQEWVEFSQLIPNHKSELQLINYPNKILLCYEGKTRCELLVEYDLVASALICTGNERSLLSSLKMYAEFVISASKPKEKIDLVEYDAVTKSHFTEDDDGKLWYILRTINRPIVYDPDLIFTQEQQSLASKILKSVDYGYDLDPDPRVLLGLAFRFI